MDPNRPPSRDLSAYSYGSIVNRDDNGNIDVSRVTVDSLISRGIPKDAIHRKYEQTLPEYQSYRVSNQMVPDSLGVNRQGQYSGPEIPKPSGQTERRDEVTQHVPGSWSPANASQDSDVLRAHYQNFGNSVAHGQQQFRSAEIGSVANNIDYGVNQNTSDPRLAYVSPQRSVGTSQSLQNDSGMLPQVQQGGNPRAQIAINPPTLPYNHAVHEPQAIKPQINRLPPIEEQGYHAQSAIPGTANGNHRESQTMRPHSATADNMGSRDIVSPRFGSTAHESARGTFITQGHGDNGRGVEYQPRMTPAEGQGNQEFSRTQQDLEALDREVEAALEDCVAKGTAWLHAERHMKKVVFDAVAKRR